MADSTVSVRCAFEENNFLHSEGAFFRWVKNFSVILVSKIENVNTTQVMPFLHWGAKVEVRNLISFPKNLTLSWDISSTSKMGENHTFFQENQNGAAIYELSLISSSKRLSAD